jgi:hypothetical protein
MHGAKSVDITELLLYQLSYCGKKVSTSFDYKLPSFLMQFRDTAGQPELGIVPSARVATAFRLSMTSVAGTPPK